MRYVLSQVAFQFGVASVEPNAEMERGPILKISPSSAGLIWPPHSFFWIRVIRASIYRA